MEDSTQLNLRISKGLVGDMDFIAEQLKIDRNTWLKTKLAELIREEKQKSIDDTQNRYVQGKLSDTEFKKILGYNPTTELKELKEGAKEASKRYFKDTLKEIRKNG